MQKKRLAITRRVANNMRLKSPPRNPWGLEPDDLRNRVQRALSMLCQADGHVMRQRLITGLAKAGVHVGSALFMLGIPAASLDDLSPSDMGKLLRYIRFNSPAAIEALAGPLAGLLVANEEPALAPGRIDKAA